MPRPPGSDEGRTGPAVEGSVILSPEEVGLSGTQTYRPGRSKGQEMAVPVARAVRVGAWLGRAGESGL